MATRVRSYSKINLGLAIGPPRPDGFHGLTTLYQTLALHDIVTVEAHRASETSITITTNHPGVPPDSRNTAWKIVEPALTRLNLTAQVKIHIQKDLPVQGGLGAGSANAAAALLGLERELARELARELRLQPGHPGTLPNETWLEIAAQVGSDVPLFLIGGAVLGTGRGEIVSAMPDLPATPCVIAIPDVGVSTPRAFQEWDALCAAKSGSTNSHAPEFAQNAPNQTTQGLTRPSPPDRLEPLSHVYASVFTALASDPSGIVRGIRPESKQGGFEGNGPLEESARNDLAGNPLLALVRTGIENDFEQVVFPQHPSLRDIKRVLQGSSDHETAIYAALSGSGSALFGLYRTEADAVVAQQRVQAFGCKAIITSTLPRAEYWSRMFAE